MHQELPPHALGREAVYRAFQTDADGLGEREAGERRKRFGRNVLRERRTSRLKLLFGQLKSPLVYVLLAAAGVSMAAGRVNDALIIAAIVFVNTLLGFSQELKAQHSIEALKKMTESRTRLVRGGKSMEVASSEVVPGDIVVLGEGDIVPADIRLTSANALCIDESVLTGESVPVQKDAALKLPANTLPYELDNMALSGTVVIAGKGEGVAVFTGGRSYLASIAEKVQEASPPSPLSGAVGAFVKKHVLLLLGVIGAMAAVALWQGRDILDVLMLVIAELVSAIPEGLPIVITLVLSIGAMALSRRNVLVRYLPTVETLGSATVIASDKTGTITQGRLILKAYFPLHESFSRTVAALANESKAGRGDPIDTALASWLGEEYAELRERYPRINVYPFDTKYRLMASANIIEEERKIVVKGAYESLRDFAMNRDDLATLDARHDAMASQGLRVLALGIGDHESDVIEEWEIEIVGLVGFLDPPKENVKEAIRVAEKAGIRVVMITGDNALTAKAIAKEVGICREEDPVLSGREMDELDDAALSGHLKTTEVYARVLPEHKYRLVKLMQSGGEIVAVTGDGANDVPALSAADLGIAMGSGTEAAKSTAKMILLDNDLSVIIEAVRMGRVIADNIRKSIYFLVSTSLDEILLISGAVLLGYPLPLYPIQILWINLVADSALDKTFPFIKEESDVMRRMPRRPDEQFFNRVQILRTLYAAVLIGGLGLGLYGYLLTHADYEMAVSVVFTALIAAIWVNGIQALKEDEPFFKNLGQSLSINPYLWAGILVGILLQSAVLVWFGAYFHVVMPDAQGWVLIALMALAVFAGLELRKWAEWYRRERE